MFVLRESCHDERGAKMTFKDRIKEKRLEAKLSQVELAEVVGVSPRTIQNYELGSRRPQHTEIVQKLAEALHTTIEYLMGSSGLYILDAAEKSGTKAAKDIEELVEEVSGLFAGGHLDEESLDGAMRALNEAYWIAKEKNKKYTPKKYRKDDSPE